MDEPQPIDRHVGYVLKRTQQALRSNMDRALADLGITAAQYAALANLERQPGLSNAELARRSFVTPQTMIRIVGALEDRGLLDRRSDAGDQRRMATTLTKEGADLARQAHTAVARLEDRMSEGLSGRDLRLVADALVRMAVNLEG